MPTLQCSGGSQPAGCRSADGRLWFSTITGLVSVDPNNVWTNPLPPRVLIENLIVDQQPFRTQAKKEVILPPGRREYAIEYTGLSFSAPERVHFRYRLQGLENEWRNAGTERRVVYSYLPPAEYKFQVIACNNDGVWNNEGATLAFTVLPFFWQTLWFRILTGTLLVLGAGVTALVIARRRYRLRLEAAERQQAIERERSRIAQDIHDDIGASLTRITLLSQSARAEDMDRIYETARNLTRSLDEIVWAVNPRHDTLDSLASYLGKFAQDFVGGAEIRCRLDVPVSLPTWPLTAETRHNVFLAFKEALNNSIKHADASEVKISLVLGKADFCIAVEDNGRGFLENSVREGNGIGNIRRRIADIGGTCEIQSAPGKGTTVRFKVPVAARALS
jgi:signal transduction histidine kinase